MGRLRWGRLFAWKGPLEERDQESSPGPHRELARLIWISSPVSLRSSDEMSSTGCVLSSRRSHSSRIPDLISRHERDRQLTLDDAGGATRTESLRRLPVAAWPCAHAGAGPAANTRARPRCGERENSHSATTSAQAIVLSTRRSRLTIVPMQDHYRDADKTAKSHPGRGAGSAQQPRDSCVTRRSLGLSRAPLAASGGPSIDDPTFPQLRTCLGSRYAEKLISAFARDLRRERDWPWPWTRQPKPRQGAGSADQNSDARKTIQRPGTQLKSPKNRVPSCLACQSHLDQ